VDYGTHAYSAIGPGRKPGTSLVCVLLAAMLTGTTSSFAREWRQVAPMPDPRWFHTAGVGSDGRIYVYGGYVWTPRSHREYGLGEWSLVIFDPQSNTWTRGPAVPKLRFRIRQINESGVLGLGGTVTQERYWWEHENETTMSPELFSGEADPLGRIHWFKAMGSVLFDPVKGRWDQAPSAMVSADIPGWKLEDWTKRGISKSHLEGTFPTYARAQASVATSPDGKVYLIGGLEGPVKRNDKFYLVLLSGVDVYDSTTNTWKNVAPMHHPRQLHAATFGADGKLYVFGGFGGVGDYTEDPRDPENSLKEAAEIQSWSRSLASVERYDPATDTWTERAPMPRPRQEMGAALGADGRIYVVGGAYSFGNPLPVDDVDIYDPQTDSWSTGPSLQHPRRALAVVAAPDGRIYAIGGHSIRSGLSSWLPGSPVKAWGQDLRATVETLETKPNL